MHDTAASETRDPAEAAEYLRFWAESLSEVLAQVRGSASACAVLSQPPAELAPASEADLWILAASAGGLRGELALRLPPATTLQLAQALMMEAPAATAEVTAEQREAALELVRQVAGRLATALGKRWGEVQLRIEAAAGPPSWSAALTAWVRAGENTAASLLEFHLSSALMAELRAEKNAGAASAVEAGDAAPGPEVKLGLLRDVELGVTLRFGSRRMLLREILDLGPGVVIELDRKVEDPVEMLLDGRLLARGEVVVMEGNYALRVTEVAPAETSPDSPGKAS